MAYIADIVHGIFFFTLENLISKITQTHHSHILRVCRRFETFMKKNLQFLKCKERLIVSWKRLITEERD